MVSEGAWASSDCSRDHLKMDRNSRCSHRLLSFFIQEYSFEMPLISSTARLDPMQIRCSLPPEPRLMMK